MPKRCHLSRRALRLLAVSAPISSVFFLLSAPIAGQNPTGGSAAPPAGASGQTPTTGAGSQPPTTPGTSSQPPASAPAGQTGAPNASPPVPPPGFTPGGAPTIPNPIAVPAPGLSANPAPALVPGANGAQNGINTQSLATPAPPPASPGAQRGGIPALGQPSPSLGQPLPFYGYDYFTSARILVDARRSRLRSGVPQNRQNTGTLLGPVQTAGSSQSGAGAPVSARTGGATVSPGLGGGAGVASGGATGATNPGLTATAPGTTPVTSNPGSSPGSIPYALAPTNGNDVAASSPADLSGYLQPISPDDLLAQSVSVTPPANYQLGTGDTLLITYSTPTLGTRTLPKTVDDQGGILLNEIGRVIVRGLTPANARVILQDRLGRYYRDVRVEVSLTQIRTIPVSVTGQAYAPGPYTVPSVTTFYGLLLASGGPTNDGTLRDIELRRNGSVIRRVDFYRVLREGGSFADVVLQPGDEIYIPPRLTRVSLTGEVRQPAVYELKEGETLRNALHWAGGARPSASAQNVQIYSVQPGADRIIRTVDLTQTAGVQATPLYEGDVVNLLSIRATIVNRVTIQGAVDQPSDYAFTPGLRVSDLLMQARGLTDQAYPGLAQITRLNPDNTTALIKVNLLKALSHDPANDIPLQPYDQLLVYSQDQVAFFSQRTVAIRGAVVSPSNGYTRSDNERVSDLLRQAGGPTPDAFLNRAALLHRRPDGSYQYDYVNLAAVLSGDLAQDALLQNNDILTVYRFGETEFTRAHTVQILGEVVSPNEPGTPQDSYARSDGMHLSDLLRLAGGVRPGAIAEVQVAHPAKSSANPSLQIQKVALVPDAAGRQTPASDILLQDGDVVTVQRLGTFEDRVSFVNVTGAVYRPGPVILRAGMKITDVIREAGGLLPRAFPQGASFTRNPSLLTSAQQQRVAALVNAVNDLINNQAFQRENANAAIQKTQALTAATTPSVLSTLGASSAIPNAAAAASAPAAASGVETTTQQFANASTVTPARPLRNDQLLPDGGVDVNVRTAILRPKSGDNIETAAGDALDIPIQPTTIQVVGAVYNSRSIVFRRAARVGYYLDQVGGVTPDAALDRAEVIRPGGGLILASKVRALQAGDIILIPTKVQAEKIARAGNSFSDFFQGLASSAIIYGIVRSLIR